LGIDTEMSQASLATPGHLTNVLIDHTTIQNNTDKGAYFEYLSNATFSSLTVTNNGTSVNSPAGFDINLKANTYSNISFNGVTFTSNGTGAGATTGPALTIKARGDSGDSGTYQAHPAHLSGVSLTNVSISGSPIS